MHGDVTGAEGTIWDSIEECMQLVPHSLTPRAGLCVVTSNCE